MKTNDWIEMAGLKNAISFLRWQLVPVRVAGKIVGSNSPSCPPAPRMGITEEIDRIGFAQGPIMDAHEAASIRQKFAERAKTVKPSKGGHPFVNLLKKEDLVPTSPILNYAFSPNILDVAHDYFNGRFIMDSLQLLYSWPTDDRHASQFWHRDFGDNRSLHCIAYISDVPNEDAGAFTFISKSDSKRMTRSPFIRRIDDVKFAEELGDGQVMRFFGSSGDSVWVDPAACYHFGSRCKVPRLALFVTFNSDRPYVAADPLIVNNRAALFDAASMIRPDLSRPYLARLLST